MKFKVGDKVKFLNEPGGGIITRIISSTMVNVAIEEGFDIPTMTSELIKIEDNGDASAMFNEDFNVEFPGRMTDTDAGDFERISPLRLKAAERSPDNGVYLAFVPHNQQWLVSGNLDILIVNNTSYDILYNFFLSDEDGVFRGADYGSVNPSSKCLVETVSRDELEDWNKGIIQLLFHNDRLKQIPLPVNTHYHIKAMRFVHESHYRDSDFLGSKALLYLLSNPILVNKIEPQKEIRKEEIREVGESKAKLIKPEALIDKYRTSDKEATVDLHIHEITDDISGLSPHDMLKVQVEHFIKCLDSAIANNYRKVTFIHGVGNGSLRDALIKKLKDYETIENRSASLAKFGVGAIDVIIRKFD